MPVGSGVGGLPGATRLGLETTYWCESYAAALPVINAEAHSGDKIWVEPWSYDVMIYYQLHGQLRRDLTILNTAFGAFSLFGPWAPQPVYGEFFGANWIVFEYRQSQFEEFSGTLPLLPEFLKSLAPPVVDIRSAGVPIMQLYHR